MGEKKWWFMGILKYLCLHMARQNILKWNSVPFRLYLFSLIRRGDIKFVTGANFLLKWNIFFLYFFRFEKKNFVIQNRSKIIRFGRCIEYWFSVLRFHKYKITLQTLTWTLFSSKTKLLFSTLKVKNKIIQKK